MILAGQIHDGETVKISAGEGGLTFTGEAASVELDEPRPKRKLH
jgi:ATP-dependent Clp protease ATP-binding subunit ClpB